MISPQVERVERKSLAELREDFVSTDADRDGRITFPEFRSLLVNLEAGMSETELRIGYNEIDTDGDGRIDFGEFCGWWLD
jgi:Ca2+-binding EF-hand superfamily protein